MLIHDPAELYRHLDALKRQGHRIGLVPTMGALHEGHLSLVRASRERCETTVVSIFVNPAQFAPNEDFAAYPRTLESDIAQLDATGENVVFVPNAESVYPAGYDSRVRVGGVSREFEGAYRPDHFQGVATIVLKLFNMTGADEAFFGQKDFQQLRLIEKMVADLNVPIRIRSCPIVREEDGLAMSSRNRFLSPEHRRQAAVLFRALDSAEDMICVRKIADVDTIRHVLRQTISQGSDAVIDYATVADYGTVRELDRIDHATRVVVLLAVRFGKTRLIDNRILEP
ncbi:MAG TPA: pantoate--beta-alanine ligase [Planctomycetaceae bacterium]|nr:pantoate--beta-alanine ligase [Planctomycetaceae bacterium]